MDNIKFESLSIFHIFLLFLIFLTIIFILYIEPKLTKRKLINKNEHGSSKFADIKEIHKNFKKQNIRDIKEVGLPVFYEKKSGMFESVYFDTKSPHYLLIGSTGSGKSATISIPMCIHFALAEEKHSVVITDPKGELYYKTGKIFKDNGYEVITIDFRNPTKSDKINIMQPIIEEWDKHCYHYKCMMFFLAHFLRINKISISKIIDNKKYLEKIKKEYNLEDYIIDTIKSNKDKLELNIKNKKLYNTNDLLKKYYDGDIKEFLKDKTNKELLSYIKENQNNSSIYQAETNRLIISLANLIFVEKETKDPFWINASKQLFIGIAGIFIEDYKEGLIDKNKINISSIKKFQNSSLIKENHIFLQKMINERSYGSLSKDYLTSLLSSAESTYKSVTAIFGEKMSIFDDLNVESITGTDDFRLVDVGKKPIALYIIVPDEDRTYFSLVTIILGMLIKDLTKFANESDNNGILPVKVEWICEEFANCPAIESIATTVSVGRSRGLRFFFFIQSYAQLDQVYGKEISSIIQDNCSLVYLKTNTYETASIIEKKLGKATITTNSLSTSIDPFKIGGNQNQSLMGRDLLTANEIISLRYKTIIFPLYGNPIFRDTYLYSDIYPEYENYGLCERKVRVMKRLIDNYYTVEKMRDIYDVDEDNDLPVNTSKITSRISNSHQREVDKIIRNIVRKSPKEKIIEDIRPKREDEINFFIKNVRDIIGSKISKESHEDGIYTFETTAIINKFEMNRIMKFQKDNIVLEVGSNIKTKKMLISFWNNNLEREL